MAKQKKQDNNTIETLFASDFVFKGSVHSEEVVLVQGAIEGTIDSSVEVYVSKHADIEADISAKSVITYGTIRGKVHARDAIEIYKSAKTIGDVQANVITIQKGAELQGSYSIGGVSST